MAKLKRKRIINRKAGFHDLSYVLCGDGKCLYQTRHGELAHISGPTFLPIHFVGATGYLGGELFLHSVLAYRDYSCLSMYECKHDLVRVYNIDTTRVLRVSTHWK